jgi:hypothetical protein
MKTDKKLAKIIAILICIIFVCTALTSKIVSINVEHIEHCYVERCPVCALIQTAINFIKILSYIVEYIVLLDVAIPLCYICLCRKLERPQITLFKLKVRLDE